MTLELCDFMLLVIVYIYITKRTLKDCERPLEFTALIPRGVKSVTHYVAFEVSVLY